MYIRTQEALELLQPKLRHVNEALDERNTHILNKLRTNSKLLAELLIKPQTLLAQV